MKTVQPAVDGRLPISHQQVLFLRNALTGVPARGTASLAFAGFPLNQIPVAGKTGTADIQGKQPTSWFAAMAPANNPKYVVVQPALITDPTAIVGTSQASWRSGGLVVLNLSR